ncbi:MAG: universal stress protein [Thermoplasmatales archaeon]|nr:MAG: universal stress protein [Thermoplasmatales archaeon]
MFKNILIPISSEFYQKEVVQTGAFLAEKFDSAITLIYIIEEKTLNQTDKRSDVYRTTHERAETKKEIIRRYVQSADRIIFNDAKLFFKNKNIAFKEEIINGEFSTVIKGQLNKEKYDLILMGFEKECLLNYRLLNEVNIPVWVESGFEKNSILAVCSNLAPNQRVPDIGIKLSKILGWDLNMLYVVDTQDTVEVDKMGKRSEKKSEKMLTDRGKQFVSDMHKNGIDVRLVRGSLENEIAKAAENFGAKLVIIGREQKKKKVLGLPLKSIKRKMVEKCRYSILFIN